MNSVRSVIFFIFSNAFLKTKILNILTFFYSFITLVNSILKLSIWNFPFFHWILVPLFCFHIVKIQLIIIIHLIISSFFWDILICYSAVILNLIFLKNIILILYLNWIFFVINQLVIRIWKICLNSIWLKYIIFFCLKIWV